jgi:S1-C subfamily serine protease
MSTENNPLTLFSKTLADATEKAGAATVLVKGRRRMPSSGIASAADLIITADHTVERDDNLLVVLPDGTEVEAEIAGRDPSSDLALLRLAEPKADVAETIGNDAVRVGELVLAVGRPSPSGIEASLGIVSAINGPVRTRRGGMIEEFIRTDAVPLPGFSGGPLINAAGQVVGINTSGLAHGTLLTLPAKVAWKTAAYLAEHGSLKRGYLGLSSQVVAVPEAATESLGREQVAGLLIVNIEAESPAAASDLMVGDIIVGVAGNAVNDHDELAVQLTGEVVGQPTAIDIIRGGVLQAVVVTIGERPTPKHGGRRRGQRSSNRGRRHHRRSHGRRHP